MGSDDVTPYLITGAPGTGKTTLVEAMPRRIRTVAEPARRVIAEERASGGTAVWGRDTGAFVRRLLEVSIDDRLALPDTGIVVLDRGVPDCIAYAIGAGLDTDPFLEAADTHRYEPVALITPPWEAIYTTDEERTATFAMIEEFHEWIVDAYDAVGYHLVEVPRGPVDERVRFILRMIEQAGPFRRPAPPGTS